MAITCEKFEPKESGALIGFADLKMSNGMIIRSCSVFRKNGMWISFPSRKYEDSNGETKYYSYIIVPDSNLYKQLQAEAIAAITAKIGEAPAVEVIDNSAGGAFLAPPQRAPIAPTPEEAYLPF